MVLPDQPRGEANRRAVADHVDQHDVREKVGDLDRVDVRRARQATLVAAGAPEGVEPRQNRMAQVFGTQHMLFGDGRTVGNGGVDAMLHESVAFRFVARGGTRRLVSSSSAYGVNAPLMN